jgi:hypothetical protein
VRAVALQLGLTDAAFNSLSRDHEPRREDNHYRSENFQLPLSGSQYESLLGELEPGSKESFNSLSRDHNKIGLAVKAVNVLRLSTPSLGITERK